MCRGGGGGGRKASAGAGVIKILVTISAIESILRL